MTNSQPPAGNQHPHLSKKLQTAIEHARQALASGTAASTLANALNQQGLGGMEIILVFREATGAGLADLKCFGQWWSETTGVTDVAAFDAWADEVLKLD
tara:strand:- start:8082 stop:8378 length:297 start_codon:yes stop_codon:yes gene_type:complete